RGTEPHDEDLLAVVGPGRGAPRVQRVPAGQEAVDLDAPGKREDVGQDPRLDLRDVDRVLLLEDAALHAVVADPVSRTGAHGIVDADEGQGPDRVALAAELVHLGDLFVEGAALERDAERVLLPGRGLAVVEAARAGVLLPLVAQQAVVRLAEDLAGRHARVGQPETLAAAPAARGPDPLLGQRRV